MVVNEAIILGRDCEAIKIPSGVKLTLSAGTHVRITQARQKSESSSAKSSADDPLPREVPGTGKHWYLSETKNKMDDSLEVALAGESEDKSASLVVRCIKRKTELYIDTGATVHSTSVRTRIVRRGRASNSVTARSRILQSHVTIEPME
ncbi:MAG TPA: hypothetical protein VOA41_03475 [Candidatus Dormibacteraeota bacterium]|nr:hypothetical protein [Candidatus Dormibacteraeota bacterium]